MDHVDEDELFDYFEARLAVARESEIEAHLVDCPPCQEEAQLTAAVLAFTQSWTAEAHGVAYYRAVTAVPEPAAAAPAPDLQALLRAALETAVQSVPAWRERLARWRDRQMEQAGAAVRVIVEAPGAASRVLAEGLTPLTQPGAMGFAAVRASVRGRQVRRAGPPPALTVAVGDTPTHVLVDETSDAIVVRVDDPLPADRRPLVLLVSLAGGAPRAEPLAPPDGGTYLSARFADVPPGEYLVAFEPLGSSGP